LHGTLFLSIFVCNINYLIMDNNEINPNTGAKGVFPGTNQVASPIGPNTPGTGNPAPIIQEQAAPAPAAAPSDTKTYIRLETKNSDGELSGVLEIDLISFRERGQESRYLSINAIGAGSNGEQSDTTLSIDNEADFNRFKKFISELNWND
jgi:hypothetical protein